MDLKESDLIGADADRHWYYDSKSRALLLCVDREAPARILDVGAGSGLFSRFLLRETAARCAVCVDPGYSEDRSERYLGKPIEFRRVRPAGSADIVLLMDVLEHVDDDEALVRELAGTAKPGTRFVVSAPAFSWLWSAHDDFLEHRRRYTLTGLSQVLRAGGLEPTARFYFFASVFPAVVVQRFWMRARRGDQAPRSDLRTHTRITNAMLTAIGRAECAVARRNRAFGLTAFVVAERR